MEHYGKKARFFVYDSKNLSEIDNFSQNSDISVMIINIQAFNSSFNADKNKAGRAGDAAARIIFSQRDSFGSRRPIPTPVGNYSPDWAIAFYEGKVKHIYFIAETKGTMDSLNLKPIEKAKIECAEKLFAQLSSAEVVYERVDSYQRLLDIIGSP